MTIIREMPIRRPSLSEQRKLAVAIDDAKAASRSIASINEKKIASLAALKQSLLHRAFAGKLTARELLAA